MFIAVIFDEKILRDYWRAQLNPFSIKKYSWPARANILFLVLFFAQFFAASTCKNTLQQISA